ncbi:hypothetical protein PoB_004222400 [Plakobranchus ocellatus]|uniref:Uncharacterized protein n=1 Tax=Plakobranchus ocellatus TaxID=259542 RepID=A0AAV4BBI8_9GAST|nr:hypothetical protein PoB_004222400 [Plakobranchus ocellatus]
MVKTLWPGTRFSNNVQRYYRIAGVLPSSDELTTCLSPDREMIKICVENNNKNINNINNRGSNSNNNNNIDNINSSSSNNNNNINNINSSSSNNNNINNINSNSSSNNNNNNNSNINNINNSSGSSSKNNNSALKTTAAQYRDFIVTLTSYCYSSNNNKVEDISVSKIALKSAGIAQSYPPSPDLGEEQAFMCVDATHGISITTGAVRGKPCTNVFLLLLCRSVCAVCLSTTLQGRQREKIMDGLATWLGTGKVSDTLAVKDRDLWRDMIANAYKQGT